MLRINLLLLLMLITVGAACNNAGQNGQTTSAPASKTSDAAFQTNFEDVEIGNYPMDFLVLQGDFAVQEINGNKALQLPGEPLNTFNLLFGPTEQENVAVSARILSESTKRRNPRFGIGLNGISGYKLLVIPQTKTVELYKNDQLQAYGVLDWESGKWTNLRFQIRKTGENTWMLEGKVWQEGQPEPDEWTVTYEETDEPVTGRPALWGTPYSGRPIYYDDLKVTRL